MVSSRSVSVDPSTPMSPTEFCAEILEERKWADGGDKLASAKFSEKVIEAKERQLVGLIEQNYSRIKDVEKELAGVQMQLKLTSGPKRSALELLRRKIEAQNEKVALARRNYSRAKAVVESAEEVLRTEERSKDQLCQELNLLIQESAHAQLEKLDQLTRRLELLNKDLTVAEVDFAEDAKDVPSSAQSAQSDCPAQSSDKAPAETSSPEGERTSATTETATVSPADKSAKSKSRQEALAAKQAAEARARHVSLSSAKPSKAATTSSQQASVSRASSVTRAFHGFDA